MKILFSKYQIALTLLVFGTTGLLFAFPQLWTYTLGPLHDPARIGYPFADMLARLEVAEGVAHGIDVNKEQNPFSPSTSLNNKPLYTVHTLALLGLGIEDHLLLGVLFGLFYLLWNCIILKPNSFLELALCAAISLSPPALMLLERGNDDIIVYSFIMIVPILMTSRMMLSHILAWSVICLVTPIKYYPAACFSLILNLKSSTRSKAAYFVASSVFITCFYLMIRGEISDIGGRLPDPQPYFAFGSKLIGPIIGLEIGIGQSIATIAFFAASSLLIIRRLPQPISSDRSQLSGFYFLLGSSAVTFCFLTASNWDYRLAFLIPTVPYCLELLHNNQGKAVRIISGCYLAAVIVSIWVEQIYYVIVMDHEAGGWMVDFASYQNILLIKHSATYVMIAGNVFISILILRPALLASIKDLPQQCNRTKCTLVAALDSRLNH